MAHSFIIQSPSSPLLPTNTSFPSTLLHSLVPSAHTPSLVLTYLVSRAAGCLVQLPGKYRLSPSPFSIMIATHLLLVFIALLSPLCTSSPVLPPTRHRNVFPHYISPDIALRDVFDIPYTSIIDQSSHSYDIVRVDSALIEEPSSFTPVGKGPDTDTFPVPSSTLTSTTISSFSPESLSISPVQTNDTAPQEMLLSVLPSVLLLGRPYRSNFTSWASDAGLLVVGLVSVLLSPERVKALLTICSLSLGSSSLFTSSSPRAPCQRE